jgi:hypothetical protein
MRRAFDFLPDRLTPIVSTSPIQAKKAGRSRALTDRESLSLVLGALGTLGRTRGVKAANAELNGVSVAVVVIEHARFGAEEEQITALSDVIESAAVKE